MLMYVCEHFFCIIAALPPKCADKHNKLPKSLCNNKGTFNYICTYNYVYVTVFG